MKKYLKNFNLCRSPKAREFKCSLCAQAIKYIDKFNANGNVNVTYQSKNITLSLSLFVGLGVNVNCGVGVEEIDCAVEGPIGLGVNLKPVWKVWGLFS